MGRKFVVYIGVRGAKLVGMKDEQTDCEVGDILSFPPLVRKFKVVGVNPLTIEPLEPIRFPRRYQVVLSPETEKEP